MSRSKRKADQRYYKKPTKELGKRRFRARERQFIHRLKKLENHGEAEPIWKESANPWYYD